MISVIVSLKSVFSNPAHWHMFFSNLTIKAELMKTLIFMFLVLLNAQGFAQEPKGTVSGKITDENGRPVYEADVFVYNGDEIIGSDVTDHSGNYLTNRMYEGNYKLQVIYGDYPNTWVENVTVKAWQNTRVNVKLEHKESDAMSVNSDYTGGAILQSTKK